MARVIVGAFIDPAVVIDGAVALLGVVQQDELGVLGNGEQGVGIAVRSPELQGMAVQVQILLAHDLPAVEIIILKVNILFQTEGEGTFVLEQLSNRLILLPVAFIRNVINRDPESIIGIRRQVGVMVILGIEDIGDGVIQHRFLAVQAHGILVQGGLAGYAEGVVIRAGDLEFEGIRFARREGILSRQELAGIVLSLVPLHVVNHDLVVVAGDGVAVGAFAADGVADGEVRRVHGGGACRHGEQARGQQAQRHDEGEHHAQQPFALFLHVSVSSFTEDFGWPYAVAAHGRWLCVFCRDQGLLSFCH